MEKVYYIFRKNKEGIDNDEPFDNCFIIVYIKNFAKNPREAEHSNKCTQTDMNFIQQPICYLKKLITDIYYEVLKEYVIPASVYVYPMGRDGTIWFLKISWQSMFPCTRSFESSS